MKQPSFASLAYSNKKRTTRRERFLAEMDRVARELGVARTTLSRALAPKVVASTALGAAI